MPQVQEVLAENHEGSATTGAEAPQRLFKNPGIARWLRADWASPVGTLRDVVVTIKRSKVSQGWLTWRLVHIPEFLLERRAALLLLQGQRLSDILIPNHQLDIGLGQVPFPIAHQILRVDPFEAWRPVPRLTNLALAYLEDVPAGARPTEVLAVLATDSALY